MSIFYSDWATEYKGMREISDGIEGSEGGGGGSGDENGVGKGMGVIFFLFIHVCLYVCSLIQLESGWSYTKSDWCSELGMKRLKSFKDR
jgi:hypothetical protein